MLQQIFSPLTKSSKSAIAFIFVMVLARGVPGQVPEPSLVEGIVTIAGTGEAVASAVVSLIAPNGSERRVTTGADGKFAIRNLSPGAYKVGLAKTGFLTPPEGIGIGELNLSPGQRLTSLVLRLLKGGVITGRLTDTRRNPRSNIRVDVLRYVYRNGQRTLSIASNSVTNDLGEYRISGLGPGDYFIQAAAMIDRSEPLAPTFYPGVLDEQAAVPITVRAGTEAVGLNFSLSSDPTYTIRVRVLVPANIAPQRVIVALTSKNLSAVPASTQAQIGNTPIAFEKLKRGAYVLSARISEDTGGFSRAFFGSATVVVADDDVDAGTITLEPGIDLFGRIASSVELNTARLRVALTPIDSRVFAAPQPVGADGTFRVSNLASGTYRVSLIGLPDTLFLESAGYAARVATDMTFTLDSEAAGPLELRIESPAGVVKGVVRNATGEAVSNAQVVLVPSTSRRTNPDLFRTALTDRNGVFTIGGVRPDDYSVLAWLKVEPGAYQDPEFLSPFESHAAKASVKAGSVIDAKLSRFRNPALPTFARLLLLHVHDFE